MNALKYDLFVSFQNENINEEIGLKIYTEHNNGC